MHTNQRGFTLMELLIAIMVSGMVFLGVFTVVRAGINTQMYVREMSDAGRQGPAILAQLSDDLENAYFYNIFQNNFFDGKTVDIGSGNRADQLHFITCRPSLLDDIEISSNEPHKSMLTEVSWVLKEGSGDYYELHRREQPMVDDKQFTGGYFRMISDRIVSMRIQYTGWKFGKEDVDERLGAGLTGGAPVEGDGEETAEDEALEWDDEWSSSDNAALPVAIKIELVVSPDIDQDVMDRMRKAGREQELDRSYIHIVLLPQYREDRNNMETTANWDGTVAEPFQQGGGLAGGATGGGRGRGRGAAGENGEATPLSGGRRGAGGGTRNNGDGSKPNSTSNPFLNIIRGGSNGGGGGGLSGLGK